MSSTNGHKGIDVVAFDGDDTLWHSESHFVDAHERFCSLVAPYVDDRGLIDEQVVATERQNLAIYGYGAKAFTLSLIETAIELTAGRITSREISAILDVGKTLLDHPVELLEGVDEVVGEPAETGRRLIVVTKGDLFHQEAKVAGSGPGRPLRPGGDRVREGRGHLPPGHGRRRVEPQRFLMIGNSVRSDVLPVVELGGHAAHLPYMYTWELEHVPDADAARQGFHELSSIRELPAWSSASTPEPVSARRRARPGTGRGGRVPRVPPLQGLALAAVGDAPHRPLVGPAHGVERGPERGADAGVGGVLHHPAEGTALDLPADLAAELEVQALVVDRPRPVGLHEDPVVGAGDHLVQRRVAGQQPDVRHADHRAAGPARRPAPCRPRTGRAGAPSPGPTARRPTGRPARCRPPARDALVVVAEAAHARAGWRRR